MTRMPAGGDACCWCAELTACESPKSSNWWPLGDTDADVTAKSMCGVVVTICSTFRLSKGVLAAYKGNMTAAPQMNVSHDINTVPRVACDTCTETLCVVHSPVHPAAAGNQARHPQSGCGIPLDLHCTGRRHTCTEPHAV